MGALLDRIRTDCQQALKKGEAVVVSTLRLLLAEVHEKEIEKRAEKKELTEDDVLAAIRREAKRRKEAIAAYEEGKRADLAEKEKRELAILEGYLPEPLSDKELGKMIREAIEETRAEGPKDVGKVIGSVMNRVKGKAEGERVSQSVKEALGQ